MTTSDDIRIGRIHPGNMPRPAASVSTLKGI